MTCIVITTNREMHTATNYYLFSLAVSDLMMLVLGLPSELSTFWQQYPFKLGVGLCKLRAYVSEMSSYVSVLTIVVFSVERYLAICYPLLMFVMSTKRAICFIIAVWLIALVFALPIAIFINVNYVLYPLGSTRKSEDSAICALLWHNLPDFPLYEVSCFLFFLVPLVLIMVLYIKMGLKIHENVFDRTIEGSIHGETRQAQSRSTITKMLSAVVVTFFFCWAPFHAQRLLYVYASAATFEDINRWLYPLTGYFYYFSTTVNPILYNVMSANYRSAFKQTLCCSTGSPSLRRNISSVRASSSREGNNDRSTNVHSVGQKPEIVCPFERVSTKNEENLCKPMLKKSSVLVRSTNGRTRCHASEKIAPSGTPSLCSTDVILYESFLHGHSGPVPGCRNCATKETLI
ncbi:neuropeptides capa receptor [Orussus abietinus]|uniref:neuropeptides capa receptor n=1 Tax=Orussus abietinus TaxID=222816 RepID=UPI00062565D9|nr:neuropeptides capa receptor [Orussus abietinus]